MQQFLIRHHHAPDHQTYVKPALDIYSWGLCLHSSLHDMPDFTQRLVRIKMYICCSVNAWTSQETPNQEPQFPFTETAGNLGFFMKPYKRQIWKLGNTRVSMCFILIKVKEMTPHLFSL